LGLKKRQAAKHVVGFYKDHGKTKPITKSNVQLNRRKPIVGFYRDKDGKTKPITKSVAELNRKKFVEGAHGFKGVGVVTRVRDTSQVLEDLMGKLNLAQDHLLLLNEQRKQLAEQNKESPLLDKEMQKTKEKAALLKNQIRMLDRI
jgi:hypothetical protein